jgi:hypothetical protein
MGDNALRPLFAAVAQNTTLRSLNCSWNEVSKEFARTVVLPACLRSGATSRCSN